MTIIQPTQPSGSPPLVAQASKSAITFSKTCVVLCQLSFLTYVLRELLGGPIRYYANSAGASLVNYIPPALAALCILCYICMCIAQKKVHTTILCAFGFLLIYVAYIPFTIIPLSQAAFGLYIILPILNGMILYCMRGIRSVEKYAIAILSISVAGVFLNYFAQFPWAGGSYEVFGVEREIAREWQYEGVSRVAGFGRSSFATANLIVVYMIIVIAMKKPGFLKSLLIQIISGVAIYVTTTKTTLIVWASIPLFCAVINGASIFDRRIKNAIYQVSIASLLAIVTILPIISQSVGISYGDSISIFSLESLRVRMQIVWPDAFEVLWHGGNLLFGRGIGGVGVPQQIFEVEYFTFADNMFLYLLLASGLVGVGSVYFGLMSGYGKLFRRGGADADFMFLATIYILSAGITTNVIEGPVQALLMGIMLAKAA